MDNLRRKSPQAEIEVADMDAKQAAAEFDLDDNGNIVTRPVLGFTIAPVADSAILARIQYAETPEQVRTGGPSVQLIMTPPQALEIAEILTKQANRILGQRSSGMKN